VTYKTLVLSACESGKVGSLGGEQLAGLSQAFLQARVRSFLVSLWQVNDPATAVLMQAFYLALQACANKALSYPSLASETSLEVLTSDMLNLHI
jgi:CHAT domain-containing protein